MTNKEIFLRGFFKENAVFTLLLGMCPALGVTSSAINGLGMGLATTFVLIMSNIVISLVSSQIPDKVKIPSFIVIIASFVTMVDLIMAGYAPALHEQLGVFIPLIVVNCLVLGRAEAFASKNKLVPSIIDGASMGLGFSMALTMLGAVREFFGAGKMFGITLYSENYGMLIFVLAPGAFIALGYLIAFIDKLRKA
ncbi:RnfABCDGE type electron transport complex subunit E [Marinifilum caeruleilacunae]|jgi:electron transport complex protein RnfE|uniref:Ion-translocating oxidoreductase complex subunit E n=1 Tax=Marinifilum caeruleilacunae TaxID=2499076 RepID=A0ABX1WTJ5_9BACT|nr:electron transport complex subunit E [Marinifilum caeruleilacunae]NOU59415.1 electron transport complex subunit E [Marinifilum caeruleilacunae]